VNDLKRRRIVILVIIIAVLLGGSFFVCTQQPRVVAAIAYAPYVGTNLEYPVTVKDVNNNEIKITKKPQRIVSLSAGITESISALGYEKLMVGRSSESDYPKSVASIRDIGNNIAPDIAAIVKLKPDMVLSSTDLTADQKATLKKAGITLVVLSYSDNLNGIYQMLKDYGGILGGEYKGRDKAIAYVNTLKKRVENIQNKISGLGKPTVYFAEAYGARGDYCATGDTFIGSMLTLAGGNNIAQQDKNWEYSLDSLRIADPQIIIMPKDLNSGVDFDALDGYRDLAAVTNSKVYRIDDSLFNRRSPRVIDGLEQLVGIIHPEATN
jgi:iron complex transport system substrate-binding protein